jgi:hypothetical protein
MMRVGAGMPRSRSLDDLNLAHAAVQLRAEMDIILREQHPNRAAGCAPQAVVAAEAEAGTWLETATNVMRIVVMVVPIIVSIFFPACRCRPH